MYMNFDKLEVHLVQQRDMLSANVLYLFRDRIIFNDAFVVL